MKVIYIPRGKAREYSPLAVNLYSGCGHKCSYCYVPNVLRMDRSKFDNEVSERNDIIKDLEKDAKKIYGSDKQVFMSFTTDPYNPLNDNLKLTRQALQIFLENKIPVSILTKSGMKAIQDIDIIKNFGSHIKIGASLTYDNSKESQRIERSAALPMERLEMLKYFWTEGVRTWVSFEPIMDPEQMLNLLYLSIPFVDEYQFGKLADDKRSFNWNNIVETIVMRLRNYNKPFYIKKTLRQAAPDVVLTEQEKDLDFLILPKFEDNKELIFELK